MRRGRKIHPNAFSIREFIVLLLRGGQQDIVRKTAGAFAITPQAVRNQLNAMIKEGTIEASGHTKARRYTLRPLVDVKESLPVNAFTEDAVWSKVIQPHISDLPGNVKAIWGTVVTEMVNNVVDHSESSTILVSLVRTLPMVTVTISDDGVGAFSKVRNALGLSSDHQAAFELSKGKFTTSPEAHSGLGIYFSSRMVDVFRMVSGSLSFIHKSNDEDWLLEDATAVKGTFVSMSIANDSKTTIQQVYDKYCTNPNDDNDFGFHKTHVPLSLAQFGNDPLVSRSQAKRVLARVDRFMEVLLDFKGVEFVGQAFADEIFRVFQLQHPNVKVFGINANAGVQKLINAARLMFHEQKSGVSVAGEIKPVAPLDGQKESYD